jgi:hypothetical protein
MTHLSGEEDRLSPRFRAFALTLPVFANGECLPLPRSKDGAFPFLLTLGGYPTAPSNFARGQGVLHGPSTPRLTCYIPLLIARVDSSLPLFFFENKGQGYVCQYCLLFLRYLGPILQKALDSKIREGMLN